MIILIFSSKSPSAIKKPGHINTPGGRAGPLSNYFMWCLVKSKPPSLPRGEKHPVFWEAPRAVCPIFRHFLGQLILIHYLQSGKRTHGFEMLDPRATKSCLLCWVVKLIRSSFVCFSKPQAKISSCLTWTNVIITGVHVLNIQLLVFTWLCMKNTFFFTMSSSGYFLKKTISYF